MEMCARVLYIWDAGREKNTAVIKGHSQLLTHREYLCCNLHDAGVDVHCIVEKSKCFFFFFFGILMVLLSSLWLSIDFFFFFNILRLIKAAHM